MDVIARTEVKPDGVDYSVAVDGRQLWHRFVRFGKRKAYRTGGAAFLEAAREQDRQAGAAIPRAAGIPS